MTTQESAMGDATQLLVWEQCRSRGIHDIMALVAPGTCVVLIDEDNWGINEFLAVHGRTAVPLDCASAGGPPPDDAAAILACEQRRQLGAEFLVVARPAFWWLEYYSEWRSYLLSRFRCMLANDCVCVFDLHRPPSGHSGAGELSKVLEAARRQDRHGQRGRRRSYAPGDLRAFERRVFSEDGEDGILEEILRRIGSATHYFVEFGVGSGRYCNCARLVFEESWQGLFMEAAVRSFLRLRSRYLSHPTVKCVQALVTASNIESLFACHGVPEEFDVLSIDIDGNDYWVWAAIRRWRPRIVVIEFNARFPPPEKWVMAEDPNRRWDGTDDFGASLAALEALGTDKRYRLVATNSDRTNAFFVRDDLVRDGDFPAPVAYHD